MSFVKGSTSSSIQAQDVYNELATLLTAHTAWSLVEDLTIGSSDFHVWKSSGAVNSWGSDFYVVFEVPTSGTGDMVIRVCGGYTAGGTMSNVCWGPQAGGGIYLPSNGGNYELSTGTSTPPASYSVDSTATQVSRFTLRCDDSSLCEYFLFVRKSSLVFSTKRHLAGTIDGGMCGFLEPLDAANEVFPLFLFPLQGGGGTTGRGYSHLKLHADALANGWTGTFSSYFGNIYGALAAEEWTHESWQGSQQIMSTSVGLRYDPLHGGIVGHRAVAGLASGLAVTGGGNAGQGCIRGLFLGCLLINTNTSTVEIGDEIDVNGVTHLFLPGSTSGYNWWIDKTDDT